MPVEDGEGGPNNDGTEPPKRDGTGVPKSDETPAVPVAPTEDAPFASPGVPDNWRLNDKSTSWETL